MSKHIKGPWKVGEESESNMESGGIPGAVFVVTGPRGVVCNTDENTREESLANARLIAAAPEMLEQLKLVKAYLDAKGIVFTGIDVVINKVEGK